MRRRILFQLMDVLLSLVRTLFADKADLAIENLALRQQFAVLHRKSPKPRLDDFDRAFWAAMKEQFSAWSDALVIVKPDTVARWHRDAFRRHWARLFASGRRTGRPRVSTEVRALMPRLGPRP